MASADIPDLQEHISSLKLETGSDLDAILKSRLVADTIEQTQMSMLCLVCHVSKVRLVSNLLEQGAEVNACGKDGMTPLHIVCLSEKSQAAHLKIATLLVQHGANLNAVDAEGSTPLILACHSNQTEMVDLLLGAGSDPNIADKEGHTPFCVACQMATDQWYFWNTEYLNSIDDDDGDVVGSLSDTSSPSSAEPAKDPYAPDDNFPPLTICRSLLHAGASPTQATLLPTAVLYGTMETVREFLELGMSVNMKDENGRSPLGCSCRASHVPASMVKLLLEHGADVDEGTSGRKEKPIILAYVFNFIAKIRILLSYGATVSPEEMSELVSISISKWFLENPDVIQEESRDLLPLKLLLKAGFRPVHSIISKKLKRVALCSSYNRVKPWIHNLLCPMPSLSDICRVKIRAQLRPCIDDNVGYLPLPNSLKSFLRFEEFSTQVWRG